MGAAVILGQIKFTGLIILPETLDVFDVGVPESVNALVIIPHGHDGDLCLFFGFQAAGERCDKVVLALVNVLVFVHQNISVPGPENTAGPGPRPVSAFYR